MNPPMLFATVVLAFAGFIAQEQPPAKDSYEGLVKEMLGTVEHITKVLITVKDRDSAQAARPELKKSAEKMLVLRKQAEDDKKTTKEEKDRLEKIYDAQFAEAVKQLRQAADGVKGVPGGAEAVAELAILKDKQDKQKDKNKKDQ